MRRSLQASGEVGHALLEVDWDLTPLGQPDSWPQSLRSAVRIVLTSRFAMWMAWGPELTFFCNDAYRRDTLGKKYPWALGKPASVVWSEIWPDIEGRVNQVLREGRATWDESLQLFLERSGYVEETYHTFSYSPLYDDSGDIAGMLCVVNENTEEIIGARRMATLRDLGTRATGLSEVETMAAASEALARNPESLPFTLTYLFDESGRVAHLAGRTGFDGPSPASPATVSVHDAHPVWPAAELAEGRTVVIADLPLRFPRLPTGAWPEAPTRALVTPLLQPNSAAPYGFLVVGLNRYRPFDDLYRSFIELIAGQISASLTDARAFEFERQRAESLALLTQAKTDLFTNVSHEFRTPLTLLLGPAEDALADHDEPLSPVQHERVEVILRNGQRLLKLVNSLLDFSRLESGRMTAQFEPVALGSYTAELAAMFASAAERAGLRFEVDCDEPSTLSYVDQEHWAKIVLNLLSNALKFTFEGGISVRLREEGDVAVLTVADTGVGIPAADREKLFERFHRVLGARSRTHEGTGVGLALVAELVALHGGTVAVESAEGVGSTFTVQLPLGSAHLPADQVAGHAESTDAARRAEGFVSEVTRWFDDAHVGKAIGESDARPYVLVVDDNLDMRDYISGLLRHDYVVTTAADGVEALAAVEERVPDLVITDVMMPRLDGFGLMAELRSRPATMGLPVVMVSARAGDEGTVEGLEAGADDYLVKPFSARELLARVRVNLELDKTRAVRASLERNAALLDQAQRLARVGSWEVDLETEESVFSDELLRLLGRSREELAALPRDEVTRLLVHPDDLERVGQLYEEALQAGTLAYETRVVTASGDTRLLAVRGEIVDVPGHPAGVFRGSAQDITEQRAAERALAGAAAREEAAAREHEIADALQRSLLPEKTFDLEHLEVATYYRAGVAGTQVGGDWYDIIELGAGRTALVVGDVMGRGVKAASTMGQLRSAVRAFAKLDLPPAEVMEHLDRMVHDLGDDQIVTCVYAVFDSVERTLRYANAGHLPPLLVEPDGTVERLAASEPPLGAGVFGITTESVTLSQGSTLAFYTDGLVERRDRDLETGIEELAATLTQHANGELSLLPEVLAGSVLAGVEEDDDVAVLVARVTSAPFDAAVSWQFDGDESVVSDARQLVAHHLREWEVGDQVVDDLVLMTSELVTNSFMHGRPPISLRMRRAGQEIVLEVQDRATVRPRRRRADDEDEHGRGLHIVATLADDWGTRVTGAGKVVWCTLAIE